MTRDSLVQIHDLVDLENEETRIRACELMLDLAKNPQKVTDVKQATALLTALLMGLLNASHYMEAALLCWGEDIFNPKPKTVRDVWADQGKYSKNLYMGGGSLGKSYNLVAWLLLDWVKDPWWTNAKIVSTSAGHAKANTWSTLTNFHGTSVIPFPGQTGTEIITLDPKNRQAAIGLVAIPAGDDGKARLQGFHPLPTGRKKGEVSRIRLLLDEAEAIPGGAWQGVDNMLTNEDFAGSVKIAAATNPAKSESIFASKAEPEDRSYLFNFDAPLEWISKEGWHVRVLDAAKTENVVKQELVYPGLQTHQGYMNLLRKGRDSEAYATFARGRYPSTTARYNVVPNYLLDTARGTYTWHPSKAPIAIGSFDPAFEEGGDEPIFTSALYGLAESFTTMADKKEIFPFPRWVIQAEQQFPVKKAPFLEMADDLIQLCKDLRIRPEWMVMDRTGNATGLHSILESKFGNVLGVRWGEGATETKLMQEGTETADLLYPDIVSEMWFAYSQWLEYGYIRHAPLMSTSPLFGELTGRRYSRMGRVMQRVESKDHYKSNSGGKSPDHADSLIMLVHLIRMRAMTNAAIMPTSPVPERRDDFGQLVPEKGGIKSTVDKIQWVDVS